MAFAIDDYAYWPKLKGAVSGAVAFENILVAKYGLKPHHSNIFRNEEVAAEYLDRALRNITPPSGNAIEENDSLIVYFSGHGFYDHITDLSYIVPQDAAEDSIAQYFSFDTLKRYLRAIRARHVLLVSDSCFSGGVLRGVESLDRNEAYVKRAHKNRSRTAIVSGGLEVVEDKGFDGQSIFNWALVETLRKSDSEFLPADQIFSTLRQIVSNNAEQTPEFGLVHGSGHAGGQFFFFKEWQFFPTDGSVDLGLQRQLKGQVGRRRYIPEADPFFVEQTQTKTEILELLRMKGPERILITGMSGVGKTEIALQALKELTSAPPTRVAYLDVNDVGFDDESASNIAGIGHLIRKLSTGPVDLPDTVESQLALWREITCAFDGWIVIDNVKSDQQWAQIQPHVNARVVAISRTRLQGFKHIFHLAPLDENAGQTLAETVANLFDPARLSPNQARRLSKACDGLPLAIRVAAASIDQNFHVEAEIFIQSLENLSKNVNPGVKLVHAPA